MRDYTTTEASAYLHVGRSAIYDAIRRGALISWKRGVTILIDQKELQRYDKIRRR